MKNFLTEEQLLNIQAKLYPLIVTKINDPTYDISDEELFDLIQSIKSNIKTNNA